MLTVAKESAKALRELVDYTSRHLRVLKVLSSQTEAWDELIIHMIETKLDVRTLRAWEEEIKSKDTVVLVDILEFLKGKCQMLERIEFRSVDKTERALKEGEIRKGLASTGSKIHSNTKGEANKRAILAASVSSGKCYYCHGDHYIFFCEKFLALAVAERIKEVKRLRLCMNCLRNDHYAKTCKMGHCRECSERHNTLCHLPRKGKISQGTSEIAESQDTAKNEQPGINVSVHHAANNTMGRQMLMATAVVDAIHRNGSSTPMRVLLDSASKANFITQAAHNRLGLKRNRISEIVSGLNEVESKVHNACEVHIKSKHSNFEINAQCLIIPKITKNLPSTRIDYDSLQLPSNLKLADAEFFKTSAIDMLIGVEFFYDLLKAGKIELNGNRLILQNTEFG